jgi:hypothetical protein
MWYVMWNSTIVAIRIMMNVNVKETRDKRDRDSIIETIDLRDDHQSSGAMYVQCTVFYRYLVLCCSCMLYYN